MRTDEASESGPELFADTRDGRKTIRWVGDESFRRAERRDRSLWRRAGLVSVALMAAGCGFLTGKVVSADAHDRTAFTRELRRTEPRRTEDRDHVREAVDRVDLPGGVAALATGLAHGASDGVNALRARTTGAMTPLSDGKAAAAGASVLVGGVLAAGAAGYEGAYLQMLYSARRKGRRRMEEILGADKSGLRVEILADGKVLAITNATSERWDGVTVEFGGQDAQRTIEVDSSFAPGQTRQLSLDGLDTSGGPTRVGVRIEDGVIAYPVTNQTVGTPKQDAPVIGKSFTVDERGVRV